MTDEEQHWHLQVRHTLEQVLGYLDLAAADDERLVMVRATERDRISRGVHHALDILAREGVVG